MQLGLSESLWYVNMIYEFIIDRGTSRQGVCDSVKGVLEFRVLGEDTRVIGTLLYRIISRGFIVIIRVRVGVGTITASAKVNAKSDSDNGSNSETRRDELGAVRNGVELCQITIHL